MARVPGLSFERSVTVRAPAERALNAFVDPHDLAEWWQVSRSVTVPRPLGTYAVEWNATGLRDEVLGRLGGAFHGTVMEFRPGVEMFVADAYWSPPEGDPIGPMALEVRCRRDDDEHTTIVVTQRTTDEGPRWRRYFEIVAAGWNQALADLKRYLDDEAERTRR